MASGKQAVGMTLSELRPGQLCEVVRIESTDSVFKRRLASLGLVPGAPVSLDRAAPFGDPRIYIVMGYCLGLRNAEAASVTICLK